MQSILKIIMEDTIKDSNVLIILGNGHNAAMNLRTGYTDFGRHYMKPMKEFTGSRLYESLLESYTIAPGQWNDLESEIKRFALSFDPARDNAEKEYEFFEWLRTNLGFYMDGEAKYRFIIGLDPEKGDKSYKDMLMDSLPIYMFSAILCNDFHFDILSFNYTWLEIILNKMTCSLLNLPSETLPFNKTAEEYFRKRLNIKYVHLSGKKCILGTDDDEKIHPQVSFMKKAYQLENSASYPHDMKKYKSILIYGHSLGETDHDFIKLGTVV